MAEPQITKAARLAEEATARKNSEKTRRADNKARGTDSRL